MLFLDGGFLLFALWVFCFIDVIVADETRVRNLPKLVWLLIVLLLPDIGSIAWLLLGRNWESRTRPQSRAAYQFPEYDRPGRQIATNPDDDEAFLSQLRARAEEQRQRAKQQRLQQEAPESDRD